MEQFFLLLGNYLWDMPPSCHEMYDSFYSIISDTETFRQRHPITDYDHYEKYVERVAKGEQKVLISEKPLILAMTSGTSGTSRMLLSTRDTNTEFFLQVTQTFFTSTKLCQHYTKVFKQVFQTLPLSIGQSIYHSLL